MSFKKGNAYIVHSTLRGAWFVVRQTSQRTWIAMQFTHLGGAEVHRAWSANGKDLWLELNVDEYKMFREIAEEQAKFRKTMFDVLMYGYFKD